MQILSSTLQLSNIYRKSEHTVEHERLRVWIDNPGRPPRQPAPAGAARFRHDTTEISPAGLASQPARKKGELNDEALHPTAEAKFNALIQLVERLTGRRIKLFDPAELQGDEAGIDSQPHPQRPSEAPPARAGFGIEYDYYAARIEEESSRFSASGIIRTADGQEINIDLELTMSRRFMEEQNISLRAGDAVQRLKDPLVINFNGTAAELHETTFNFDLDSDGREEQVALLNPGSGFLALDQNGDGTINNGGELFGTQSGDGFADLAAHDEDGNQWIDENDSIYNRLRIWNRDSSGNEALFALGEKGVGAIYLGSIGTPFDLTGSDNRLLGQVASSGIFLGEEGNVGSVQQINLVV